jgi:hypothetical protein
MSFRISLVMQCTAFEFEKRGREKFGAGEVGTLYINDEKVREGKIPRTVKFMYANYEGFDIGIDAGTPVTDEYKSGARFTSKIEKVMIDLFGRFSKILLSFS